MYIEDRVQSMEERLAAVEASVYDKLRSDLAEARQACETLRIERDNARSQASYECAAEWRATAKAVEAERDVLRGFAAACSRRQVIELGLSEEYGFPYGFPVVGATSSVAKRCLELADAARRGE